jgi:hypothetical protein
MTHRVLIFGLHGFKPRSKPVDRVIKAHSAAHEAEAWHALQELEGEDLVKLLFI